MLDQLPSWAENIPFACLVTERAIRKGMTTRIIEALIVACIGGGFGGYVMMQVAQAKVEVKVEHIEKRFDAHISQEQIERAQILAAVTDIRNCLMQRTCTK